MTRSTVSDLLDAARAGDQTAFAALLDHFHPMLSEQATAELGSTLTRKVGASDLVQESMLEAFRDFQNFRGSSVVEFRAWLERILEHRAGDIGRRFRAARRDVAREVRDYARAQDAASHDPGASTIAQDREAVERVEKCLQGLTEDERSVVMLRYRDELGFDQIAATLGWSRERARRTWYAAIEQIGRLAGDCR